MLTVYDKASYHYSAEDYPSELSRSQAFVHTGFFLGWLIKNNLVSERFISDWNSEVNEFLLGNITGPNLFEVIDGTLTTDDLNEEGNAFASSYFSFVNGARYTYDYEQVFFEYSNLYTVQDTELNFGKISYHLTDQYKLWKINSTVT